MSEFKTTSNVHVRSGPGIRFDIWDTLEKGRIINDIDVAGWCPVEMEDLTVGWVSRDYLIIPPAAPVVTGPPPVVVPPSVEPVWIQWARRQIGQHEIPGPKDNPVIAAWYHLTTLDPEYWHDATAWCAVFVNAAFMLNNYKTIRSARAVDWLDFGEEVETPQKGDVTIFDWGDDRHHVSFYMQDVGHGRIDCLGGNQHDGVNIAPFPVDNVMGYRRPTEKGSALGGSRGLG